MFQRVKVLVDGNHAGCIEARKKCGGSGEFDGQSVFVHFRNHWFLYTRANPRESGHRSVQVAIGKTYDELGPFQMVTFNTVPAGTDIYLPHMYVTPDRTAVVAILPVCFSGQRDGGIFAAYSSDGITFSQPLCIKKSETHNQRTSDMPVHGIHFR